MIRRNATTIRPVAIPANTLSNASKIRASGLEVRKRMLSSTFLIKMRISKFLFMSWIMPELSSRLLANLIKMYDALQFFKKNGKKWFL